MLTFRNWLHNYCVILKRGKGKASYVVGVQWIFIDKHVLIYDILEKKKNPTQPDPLPKPPLLFYSLFLNTHHWKVSGNCISSNFEHWDHVLYFMPFAKHSFIFFFCSSECSLPFISINDGTDQCILPTSYYINCHVLPSFFIHRKKEKITTANWCT